MEGSTKPDFGKAYLLFQHEGDASLKELKEKIAFTKKAHKDTPQGLELTLVDDISQFATEDDPELTALLKDLEHPDNPRDYLTHGLKATLKGEENREVAKHLKEFSQKYFSQIYKIKERKYVEPILKLITYKSETGEYIGFK
jgi:hypothetical protein